MTIRINNFIPFTRVEGPGNRACIWVQGCTIRCSGCSVPWTWNLDKGKKVDVDELITIILNIPGIEGVTFSGGEPFLQARELFLIAKGLKNKADFSIVIFTGFYLEEIKEAENYEWEKLLSVTDLLIAGPYEKDKPSKTPWLGSSNQNIHFLTSRYIKLKDEILSQPNKIEIHINPDSSVFLNGNVKYESIKDLFKEMTLKKE